MTSRKALARPQQKSAHDPKDDVVQPMAPQCPPELGPVARDEWLRIVPELATMIELTSFDRGPLAIYCVAYQRWIEATANLQKYGSVIKSSKGHPYQSPYLSIANREADTMLRIAAQYGFTPTSRASVFPRESTGLLPIDDCY